MKGQKKNKSFSKRIKVTRKGKVLARKPGQGHFNAKERGSKTLAKKGFANFTISNKNLGRFLQKNK
mgnify:FL=1